MSKGSTGLILAAAIVVFFFGWIIKSNNDFSNACFEAGGIKASVGGHAYCIPKDTKFLMRR